MKKLNIYKASAGSGKTFTLAVEYIRLLIENPYNYNCILAVTFTNKATSEMKDRIISKLHAISVADKSANDYLYIIKEKFKQENIFFSEKMIQERAAMALELIIHDYSHFHIETIDSFFQSIIRQLARELNLTANLRVDLNKEEVLHEAVIKMIDKVTENADLHKAILSYIFDNISINSNWKITSKMEQFSKNIFNEKYMKNKHLSNHKNSINNYFEFKTDLIEAENKLIKENQEIGNEFIKICTTNGFLEDDFAGKSKGIYPFFFKISKNGKTKISKSIIGYLEKPISKKQEILVYENTIIEFLSQIISNEALLKNIMVQKKNLNQTMLLSNIDQITHNLNDEANRFLLVDSSYFLRQLIDENDVPFIYEKVGTTFKYIMIDEFQDTSELQWDNFRPLINNSLSNGYKCLLVGDVKQSIYRWRNSDWEILNNISKSEFSQAINEFTLDTNYRSAEEIILFNNNFFTKSLDIIKSHLESECEKIEEKYINSLFHAYSDVSQKVSNNNIGKGYVFVESFTSNKDDEKNYKTIILEKMTENIISLLDAGLSANNIAILARSGKDIVEICSYLNSKIGNRVKIISNEAFKLKNSSILDVIINALKVLIAPEDHLACVCLAYKYLIYLKPYECDKYNIKQLCKLTNEELIQILPEEFRKNKARLCYVPLYELCERLCNIFFENNTQQQDAYLFSFFDELSEYVHNTPTTIQSFLEYWEEYMREKCVPNISSEGIKLMTIHKSKGLEFHTVFIPFCDWAIDPNLQNQILWCKPKAITPHSVPLVALSYEKNMRETVYKKEYNEEFFKINVDNLNLLYVAFTRASQNLYIYTGKDEKCNKYTEYDLLNKIIFTEDKTIYESGNKSIENTKNQEKKSTNITPFENSSINIQILQTNKSRDLISQQTEEENETNYYIDKGLVIHKIMESISTIKDIDKIINQLDNDGTFPSKEFKNDIKATINNALKNPCINKWFSNEWNTMNECNIIYCDEQGQAQSKRPDRVIFNQKETIVIDYKTGKQSVSHAKQIVQYIKLLKQMNYPNVHGYLWYMQHNDIINIEDKN